MKKQVTQELVEMFAEAYHNLGYSSLMGKIVALLIASPEPLSLDDISEELQMSKGPISQICRKLKEHNLIEKAWIPGERKDFYKATDDIFGQAFRNYARNMQKNKLIAQKTMQALNQNGNGSTMEHLTNRMQEMEAFYELMKTHHENFLSEWHEVKSTPADL